MNVKSFVEFYVDILECEDLFVWIKDQAEGESIDCEDVGNYDKSYVSLQECKQKACQDKAYSFNFKNKMCYTKFCNGQHKFTTQFGGFDCYTLMIQP